MRANTPRAILTKSVLALFALILSGVAVADGINLTASSTSTTLPDGQTLPMWGYTCGAVVSGSTATCAATNPNAATSWSPVLITVPAGTPLTINLTNNLPIPPGGTGIPTSLVVVGQLGGGLGSTATTTVSPAHATLGTSWPVAAGSTGPQFTPPAQGPRVQSFSTEVANGATTALNWDNLKPGTYLIESGTHPSIQGPMGLYGVLVVTTAPSGGIAGTAYPTTASHTAVTYNAEVPLLLSEIDPVQNAAVNAAVNTKGFSETAVWSGQPGGCGNPASATYHTCYPPAVNYDPRYYLINGASFDRTNAAHSLFAATPATATGTLLVRFVNAGLRMHVPSIVGAQTTDSSNATMSGFSLVAEDGNVLPGNPKIQNEVFLAAGKTYDVLLNAPASGASALPVFDRQLSLSTNNRRDGGMQAYLQINGSVLPSANTNAVANADSYYLVTGNALSVTEPSKGVIANDIGVYGVALATAPTGVGSTLTLNPNGTFTYIPGAGVTSDTFTYCGNGATSGTLCTTVTLAACGTGCLGGAPTANADNYTSTVATRLHISPPGVLSNDIDPAGHPLTVDTTSVTAAAGVSVIANADGSFSATTAIPGTYTFTYKAKNSQNTLSAAATVTLNFPAPSNLAVNVKDAKTGLPISDYRWIIEEDRTFYIDPKCQINSTDTSIRPASCPPLPVQSMGYNFHTAAMPVVATGCVGAISCESGQTLLGIAAACDTGNGVCHTDASQKIELQPNQVYLDPTKRYYISILPGDGINPTIGGAGTPQTINGKNVPFNIARDCGPYSPGADAWVPGGSSALCGHGMGGAPLAAGQTSVNIGLQETPLPTAQIAVFVYEDDNPLNGENDAGGGVDILAPNEPGLGGFEIKLWDQAGGLGDATGQITYDMFNMPVSNSLAGKIDPITGLNACPITASTDGLVGMVPTCPTYESDGKTMSPLAGQAVIANLYPGLYEVIATPASDRIGRGEEWLQTNTLDGGKAHEAFIKPAEPSYFQEFGPGGFHVMIGFANPKIINDRKTNSKGTGICDPYKGKDPVTGINIAGGGLTCTSTLSGKITNARMSRTPDQRIYSSGSYDAYSFTQCYVGLGAPDEADFAFAKCDPDGNFTFTNIPQGNFKLTVFDQWNDIMLDGLVSQVKVDGANVYKEFPVTQWRTNLYTRTFIDTNGDGVSQASEPGLPLVPTNIRYRDGSYGFYNNTDLNGYAGFNEVFPFMNWLVVEADSTRFKPTGVHVVYDFGGPADGFGGGTSTIASGLANTLELNSVPANLRVPGAVYCTDADCSTASIANGTYYNPTAGSSGPAKGLSTGRIDPPWATTQGWQGLLGQSSFIEFGMKPFAAAGTDTSGIACTAPNTPAGCNANFGKPTLAENGGIKGHVIYASTRPFDDPSLLLQLQWEPGVAHVKINLYQEGTAADGTTSLKLVDTTTTTSWDDWAQGFRSDGMPNMNCPGQDPTSPFFATLQGSTQFLDPSSPKKALPNSAQFKCYDGWSMLNQVQPAPYDGMYKFPSVTAIDPATGRPAGTNCTACVDNPTGDGTKMLPAGKYVVEVIVPPGFELVKEEDKNILMGDVYIAPVTQQFAGLGSIFILPDQAAINAYYNANNPQNQTTNLGSTTMPRHEGDTGSMEAFWPCVGATRIVPDYMSLFPGAGQVAPFAGASRPLCDRKEVTLTDQMAVLAKFYVFTPTHVAGHFTGTMTNDLASEFDPFSPQFGEKFGPPNLPVAMRDFAGNEVSRTYGDQWGIYNGLFFSSWEVNPPNPTGYAPQMSIACMNDPGPIPDPAHPGQMMTDPNYSPAYSNFCYEMSFMPGFTAYMDTPVVPTMAFAEGYNLPDTEYPNATPAIGSVTGSDGIAGPWVSNTGAGHSLTITALGDKAVQNPAFSGPNATAAPYNQKTVTRHYGFGGTTGTVSIAGVNAPVTSWSDTSITVTVPSIPSSLNTTTGVGSTCYNGNSTTIPAGQTPPQRGVTGNAATNYRCGELVITAANGKKSIDAITVTVAGKTPTYVTTASPSSGLFGQTFANPLQTAIDNATPGDLIIVGPGTYKENLLMWKPVRLQGVGAAAVTINADAHPAGKMDPWRKQVNCLFGLTIDGAPNLNNGNYDPSGTYDCPASMFMRSDRIPFEGFVGWDASSNGNLAQVLQEPTLMGAYEGAGVTVLGRGIRIPTNSNDFWGQAPAGAAETAGAFPDGSTYLTNSSTNCTASTTSTNGRDYGTGNFKCNPSRIDGVSIINSSQGGGAIFMHGWNHYMEISNTRISANTGTLSGGINVGNGETPPSYINDGTICGPGVAAPAPLCPPLQGTPSGAQIPFGLNVNVHVHHNAITANASLGDALFSGTPSGAGGITFSAGDDNYKLDHNWISGNLSNGDGAGVEHSGFSVDGNMSNNWVLFNQSTNPTLPTNGGGIGIIGANTDRTLPNGQECGTFTDVDCPPGIGDGTGPGLVIDANLIMGNSAEGGSGGGLRLQQVNGSEVGAFPLNSARWYDVSVTNNIIANNVAGWDGGGVSLEDALKVSLINNTVVSNDTTGSAGVLFKTLGAPYASSPPPGCTPNPDPTAPQDPSCTGTNAPSVPQPAGLVTMTNTPNMRDSLPANVAGTQVRCPTGYGYGSGNALNDGSCRSISLPKLENNLFWQNRAFHIEITGFGTGLQSQQHLVTLVPTLNQTSTGNCASGANYWDVGARGDISPADHSGGGTLSMSNSILTSLTGGYTGNGNLAPSTSPVIAQYCNGSRVPPENGGKGYNVPAGRSETTGLSPVFELFNITPAATVDEGNNWINLSYGPLTLYSTAGQTMVASNGNTLGAYSIASGSPAVNNGSNAGAPATDFFGNTRPRTNANPADIGAVEFAGVIGGGGSASAGLTPLTWSPTATRCAGFACLFEPTQVFTLTNTGSVTLTGIGQAVLSGVNASSYTVVGLLSNCGPTGNGQLVANTSLAPGASCTVAVRFQPATNQSTGVKNATVSVTDAAGTQTSTLTGTAR